MVVAPGCERVEVVGHVDVEGETGILDDAEAETESACLLAMAVERAGSVGEPEPGDGRDHGHVRPVVAAVGHEDHAVAVGDVGEAGGAREVGMGHHNPPHTGAGQLVDARLDGAVEAPPGLPHPKRPPGAAH